MPYISPQPSVRLGRRCLLIDLDMNQGATRHLGVPSNSFLGSYEVLIGEEQPEDVIITNGDDDVELPKNVDLIAASRKLENTEQALRSKSKFIVDQNILIKPLESLAGQYDYIFLDTAPNANTPTIAAYKAARWFILAAMPDPLAITGLNDALMDIQDAQNNGNPDLEILGVILCRGRWTPHAACVRFDRLRREYLSLRRCEFGEV